MASLVRQSRNIAAALESLVLAVARVTERDIQNDIQKELSHGANRLFRINCGQAWQGRVLEQTPDRLILSPWYPIRLAAEGISDLLGWTTVDAVAVFTAIEVKDRGRLTPEQSAFLKLVQARGGRAGVARSVEDARLIIGG